MFKAEYFFIAGIIISIFITCILITAVGFVDLVSYTFIIGLIIYSIVLSYTVVELFTAKGKVLHREDYFFSLVGSLVFLIPVVNVTIFFMSIILLIINIEE